MPYIMCPICGSVEHLNVADSATWYAERHPDSKTKDLVPEPCFFCFTNLDVDDRVITRRWAGNTYTIEAGQIGVVKSKLVNQEFGSIYELEVESGKSIYCPRGAIKKCRKDF